MFLKITRSGPRQYLQLVEAFRDDAGKAKHRTLVTLGRLDQLSGSLDAVISGLLKITGRPDVLNAALPPVEFESARALGHVWALNELWETLGFGELRRVFRRTRHSIDVEALIRVMVFNRLCDPESKLGVLRWLETVTMLERFPSIRRVVLVADRGLLSLDNLDALSAIRLESGEPLEFVLAVPGRRYSEFVDLLRPFHEQRCTDATDEVVGEMSWRNLRLVVAHDPHVASETKTLRQEKIQALEAQAGAWVGKLDAQDAGAKARGKKLSDSGAKARLYHAVKDSRLAHIVRVDLKNELFAYDIDHNALALAELMDGKLLLVTNTPDLSPANVVARYKSLADIERGFRVLKSEIEIGPVYHRLPERIKAHASICFIALILYRVMRQRLSAADSDLSPERALAQLQRIQHHQIRINHAAQSIAGISRLSEIHDRVFAALNLKKPAQPQQLPLL